ncbi:hypothetical protein [Fusibacter ferrireducens]|uniref:Uncharacterized protein n=1 Tax=Fusibacter ferrireducens TaxID=2785058 RepID=A0ABR9ZR57_9FIRM|nr:hypothetical protein [Fusibacter ferrireducens]MBF4692932.1 hypothetical protein [Fusibacter ferrireducens]
MKKVSLILVIAILVLGYTHTESGTTLVTTNAITVVMDIYLNAFLSV